MDSKKFAILAAALAALIPVGGCRCQQGEVCVEEGAIPRCVPVTDDIMTIQRQELDPQPP